MKSVVRTQPEGKWNDGNRRSLTRLPEAETIDSKVALIQALIPLGLQVVAEAFEEEVTVLAGPRYNRTGGQPDYVRWGHQRGSVYLMNPKLPITYTRVRNRLTQPGKGSHSGLLWLMTAPPFVVPRCRRYIAGRVDRIISRNLRSGGEISSGARSTSMSETSFRSQAVWSAALNSFSVCTQAPAAPRACATFT